MFNNSFCLLAFIFCFFKIASAQQCTFEISGVVLDGDTGKALEHVNIFVNETKQGAVSDSTGNFIIENLCSDEYHIVLSHIGCESKQVYLNLNSDTLLSLTLDHAANLLHDIVISGSANPKSTQIRNNLSEQEINDQANENLSNILSSIAGVSTLKNGNGIAIPIVHGLYGNRLTILNNGVSQSGQQWGNDHSPEIDPLVANKIQVIKGTSSLEYLGSNLGSVILIEPQRITKEPHLHGKASYFFESNGLGHSTNLQFQQHRTSFAWKLNGTLKRNGDKKSSAYFLNNTGTGEANIALQLEKAINANLSVNVYFSSFNSELGVLRGAHVGNLTDLESAFSREIPFFTEDKFSYRIDAPRQEVNHHLLKLHSKYFLDQNQWLEFTFASQVNIRKEFDVRRGDRNDIPALSLFQNSFFSEAKHQREWNNGLKVKSGIQSQIINNTNNPETGILPLIPDYLSYQTGTYLILSSDFDNSLFEVGLRYDNIIQNAVTISTTLPREILRYNNIYNNFGSSFGYTHFISDKHSISANIGYASRNPGINELYSGGLHQGVSGIEEGNIDLESEQSIKSTLSFRTGIRDNFSLEGLVYGQHISNYIFLLPQDEIRLTIRGAFPVFKYEQTNAQIIGLDLYSSLRLSESLSARISYSYIQGNDLEHNLSLINIPSNNLRSVVEYELNKPLLFLGKSFENLVFEINNQYVFRQNQILPEQDFVAPPDAYNLFAAKMASDVQFRDTRLRLVARIDNLFNVAYRDYLNRQRYFADDMGINFSLGITLKF